MLEPRRRDNQGMDTSSITPTVEHLLAEALSRQSELNQAIARGLQAMALTADRYDAELSELREGIAALSNRQESIVSALRALRLEVRGEG